MLKNYKRVVFLILIALLEFSSSSIFNKQLIANQNLNPNSQKPSTIEDYSAPIEKMIRAGSTSTADLILYSHPRLLLRGKWDWDKNNYGSFAWRIMHGEPCRSKDPNCDNNRGEFNYCTCGIDYGADYMYSKTRGTYRERVLEPIIAGKAIQLGWHKLLPKDLPWTSKNPDYDPQHTVDEYFADARSKLIYLTTERGVKNEWPWNTVLEGSIGYDWLVNEKYSNGNSVLTQLDRQEIQRGLIANAEFIRSKITGNEQFFNSGDIAKFVYIVVGLALYEPARLNDPGYREINAKAREYLDEFDKYWIGKILPALNEQGGDGGWHGGQGWGGRNIDDRSKEGVVPWQIAPFLFAHATATGQSLENSVFSSGVMKYAVEFQNHMIRPVGEEYYDIKKVSSSRYAWILPIRMYSRRRYSGDPEQQMLGELGAWVRFNRSPRRYVNAGSHDMRDQLLFEDKMAGARSPEEIGFRTTRHFNKLGWIFMRSGFTSSGDLAGLFICQRFHWSELDRYAQNSFTLERKGKLIEGYQNTIWLDDQCQRVINGFPTISDGIQAYAPGSKYDVGPGIKAFKSTTQYDYMIGDATNAYDKDKLEKFTREIVWVKENDTVIIFDRVVSKKDNVKKSWVIDPGGIISEQGTELVKIANQNGALLLRRILPEQAVITMNESRFEVVPKISKKETYFLHVMQAVDADMALNSIGLIIDEARFITSGNKIHIELGKWEILFNSLSTNGFRIRRK